MNSSPLFLHYVLVPVLPAFEPSAGESAWNVLWGGAVPPPLNTLHVPSLCRPTRFPALPQDLPVHAACLHIWNLVSALFPGPFSLSPCFSSLSQTAGPPALATPPQN